MSNDYRRCGLCSNFINSMEIPTTGIKRGVCKKTYFDVYSFSDCTCVPDENISPKESEAERIDVGTTIFSDCPIILTDITGVLGQMFEAGFDDSVSLEIRRSLHKAYLLAVEKLGERLE